jgi:hypothetical protein
MICMASRGVKISVVLSLLGHVAHPDDASRHQLLLFKRLPGLGDQPGEILHRTDLQGYRMGRIHRGSGTSFALQIIGHGYETTRRGLVGKPVQIGQIG